MLKIFDVRALQHPRPLEIMSYALQMARLGDILLMIHRREPFPLYDIINVQGLMFRTFKGSLCAEFVEKSMCDLVENMLDSKDLAEFLQAPLKSPKDSNNSPIELALLSDENDNSINFTSDFYLKHLMPNENLPHKQENFFIFIAQRQILHHFQCENFLNNFTQILGENSNDFILNDTMPQTFIERQG